MSINKLKILFYLFFELKPSNNAVKTTVTANNLTQKIISKSNKASVKNKLGYSKNPSSLNAMANKPNLTNAKHGNDKIKSATNLVIIDKSKHYN